MSQLIFNISLSPREAYNKLQDFDSAELVYDEFKNPGEGKYIAIMVFEKYFFRSENRAALTVIIDNFKGTTSVTAVTAGSSKGFIFNFDWGGQEMTLRKA